MLLRDSDFEATLSRIVKKWDNESDFTFCKPKKV